MSGSRPTVGIRISAEGAEAEAALEALCGLVANRFDEER